jgi:hypothetical protein
MRRMRHRVVAIVVLAIGLGGCSSPARPSGATGRPPSAAPSAPAAQPSPDPATAAALVRIAQVFNTDYGQNDDGPVYDRWDARSQAVISRAEYIRRHAECATAPQAPAHVVSAAPGPHGAWLVRYEIGGQQFTDYWFYTGGRWRFDLLLSNPAAERLYRLPAAQYAAAVGCTGQ